MIYKNLISHYEECFTQYGDTHKGVDWPTKERAEISYRTMLDIVKYYVSFRDASIVKDRIKLLDFGCGLSHMYDFMLKNSDEYHYLDYFGLDISEQFLEASKAKYQNIAYCNVDILENDQTLGVYDFIIMNGIFTEKLNSSHEEMEAYFHKMINTIIPHCRYGLAFNLISKQVDWERDDLFHVALDDLSWFLCKEITRDFVIRNDYGEYAYTAYVFPKLNRLCIGSTSPEY